MRYGRDHSDRVWYGGGGLDDGDSDVEFGYSAGGFGQGNYGGRSFGGYDAGYRRGGAGRDMRFGNWEQRSGMYGGGQRGGYDRGYGGSDEGWGMNRMYNEIMHGGPASRYERDFNHPIGRGEFGRGGGQGRWEGQGRSRFTGMESNRYRGVYDSGFRAGQNEWGPSHGGYRGEGWNRGGGMNPGRRPGW